MKDSWTRIPPLTASNHLTFPSTLLFGRLVRRLESFIYSLEQGFKDKTPVKTLFMSLLSHPHSPKNRMAVRRRIADNRTRIAVSFTGFMILVPDETAILVYERF
jgi:hypothetical protein